MKASIREGNQRVSNDTHPQKGAACCRVLLAEDDFANRLVATHILEMLDFEVHAVANGAEALECCLSGTFDLVVMDVRMHDMDGLEAIRRIRAFERETGRPPLPILCVTADAFLEYQDVRNAAGACEYLAKPYSIHLFEKKLIDLRAQWQESKHPQAV